MSHDSGESALIEDAVCGEIRPRGLSKSRITGPVVVWVGRKFVSTIYLQNIELHEEHQVAHQQSDGEAANAFVHSGPAGHGAVDMVSSATDFPVSCLRSWRRSFQAANRSLIVGSSGSSPLRRALLSLTRISRASRM